VTARTPIRVVVAAGAAVLGASRRALQAAGFVVAAECADAPGAVAAVARLRPDVLVVDSDLPGGALVAAAAVSAPPSPPPVLVVGATGDGPEQRAAELAGASGYLGGDVDGERIADAVAGLVRGTHPRKEGNT
jgi:DNA-binding NarL/FixJ family response regulator